MKPYVQISIRTKAITSDIGMGAAFVESISDGAIAPDKVSNMPGNFSKGSSLDFWPDYWAPKATLKTHGLEAEFFQDFAWKRSRKLKGSGSVAHTGVDILGEVVPGSINFRSDWSEEYEWHSLFRRWCEVFGPQLGMLHVFSGEELMPERRLNNFQIGSFGAKRSPKIHGIGWAMFYGEEFRDRINIEGLLDVGFSIEFMASGCLVVATSSISDVINDAQTFMERRDLEARYLDDNFLCRDY